MVPRAAAARRAHRDPVGLTTPSSFTAPLDRGRRARQPQPPTRFSASRRPHAAALGFCPPSSRRRRPLARKRGCQLRYWTPPAARDVGVESESGQTNADHLTRRSSCEPGAWGIAKLSRTWRGNAPPQTGSSKISKASWRSTWASAVTRCGIRVSLYALGLGVVVATLPGRLLLRRRGEARKVAHAWSGR